MSGTVMTVSCIKKVPALATSLAECSLEIYLSARVLLSPWCLVCVLASTLVQGYVEGTFLLLEGNLCMCVQVFAYVWA